MTAVGKRPKSLRVSVTMLIVLCWVLPLLAMSVTGGFYTLSSQKDRIMRDTVSENRHNTEMTIKIIDDAIGISRDTSRISTIYHGSLYSFWRNTPKNTNLRYWNIVPFLNYLYSSKHDYEMAGVFFFDDTEELYYTANRDWSSAEYFSAAHDKIVETATGRDGRIGFFVSGENIYILRNLLDRRDFSPFGTMVLCMRLENVFGSYIQSGQKPQSIDFWVSGEYGHIGEEREIPDFSLRRGEDTVSFDGLSLLNYGISTSGDDYTITVFLQWMAKPLWDDIQLIAVVYLAISLSSLLMLFGVLRFFSRQINRPLNLLSDASKRLESGDLGTQAEPFSGNRDFQHIINTFNSMSEELKKQFDRIYDEEISLKDAKIMALRSQINPHFLYNTLDLMNWQARLNGQADISAMIGALSTLLDASLNRSDTREVPLRDEIAYADAFIFILSKRYGSQLKIEKEIDQKLLDTPVPPLVFQPLMENAVEHGFEKNRERYIKMVVRREESHICMEIINSGILSESDMAKIKKILDETAPGEKRGTHLGIMNVKERLKLLYGNEASFDITTRDGFTVAHMSIPLKRSAEQQNRHNDQK